MLPFLAYPQHYTQSTLTHYAWNYLKKVNSKPLRILRIATTVLFAFAILVAGLPFVRPIYAFKWALLYVPSLMLSGFTALRTLIYVSSLVQREADSYLWEGLILTGVDAHSIVLARWFAVIRYFRKDYLFIALLRLFTAYGLAAYFSLISAAECPLGLNSFCYGLTGSLPSYPMPALDWLSPPLLFLLFSFGLLAIFAMFELAILSAIGIFATFMKKRKSSAFLAICIRVVLGIIGSAILVVGTGVNTQLYAVITRRCDCYNVNELWIQPSHLIDTVETLQTTFSSFIDFGTLMTTNFLRGSVGENNTGAFLIRNVFAVVLGVLLLSALLWLLLRLSTHLAVKQGALPPSRL